MAMHLKNRIAVFALVVTAQLVAYDESPCCVDYRVNPPLINEGCGFSGSFHILYWKPYLDQMNWAYNVIPEEGNVDNLDDDITDFRGQVETKNLDPDWDFGFRVGLGYNFPCDMWTFNAEFTHFTTDHDQSFATINTLIEPGFLIGYPQSPSAFLIKNTQSSCQGKVHWELSFNQVDFDFKRAFYAGCSFVLTPYVGLRGLWIHQKGHVDITNDLEGTLYIFQQTVNTSFRSDLRTDYKSFGLKGGIHLLYEMECGLGIYGDVAGALVYGCLETSHLLNTRLASSIDGNPPEIFLGCTDASYSYNALRGVFDFQGGLEWRTSYHCDQASVYFRLGWEHHIYLNQNAFLTIQKLVTEDIVEPAGVGPNIIEPCGNLSLWGLVLSVGADF